VIEGYKAPILAAFLVIILFYFRKISNIQKLFKNGKIPTNLECYFSALLVTRLLFFTWHIINITAIN
jgi:hypothetical protein